MKKKSLHTHLQESGRDMGLTHEERMRMRGVLSAYMAMKPVREAPVPSPFSFVLLHRSLAFALVVTLFVSSAGVSYAAEGSLPGEVLYTVKTYINEPVAGFIARSPEAKAEWAMRVASARAKEVAALSAQGALDADTEEALRADFETHAQRALASLEEEEQDSPEQSAELAARFEARLSEYERIVSGLGLREEREHTFATALARQRERLVDVRTRAESRGKEVESDVEIRVAFASRLSTEARSGVDAASRLAHKSAATLTEDSAAEISITVDGASSSVADGEVLLHKNVPDEAVLAFRRALAVSERVRAYLEANAAVHRSTGRSLAQVDSRGSGGGTTREASMLKTAAPQAPSPEGQTFSATLSVSATDTTTTSATSTEEHDEKTEEESGDVLEEVTRIIPVSVPPPSLRF